MTSPDVQPSNPIVAGDDPRPRHAMARVGGAFTAALLLAGGIAESAHAVPAPDGTEAAVSVSGHVASDLQDFAVTAVGSAEHQRAAGHLERDETRIDRRIARYQERQAKEARRHPDDAERLGRFASKIKVLRVEQSMIAGELSGVHASPLRPQHESRQVVAPPAETSRTVPREQASGPAVGSAALRTVRVRNGTQLTRQLRAATPGERIVMSPGVYEGEITVGGETSAFAVTRGASGTARHPITLVGSRRAVIDAGTLSKKYGLHVVGARFWHFMGFSVRDASKGVVSDGGSRNLFRRLGIHGIGEEGLHLRGFSKRNTVTLSHVWRTGLKKPQYGEGIYVGSANSNWGEQSGGRPDRSDGNRIVRNTIGNTGAESVDIKEGTRHGLLARNRFNGKGMSGKNFADSWVDVKGNRWTIRGNRGIYSILDGFQVHTVMKGWGIRNIFRHNRADVRGPGVGYYVEPKAQDGHNNIDHSNVTLHAKGGWGTVG